MPSTVSARVSTNFQLCSLHLCGFAQNKNRGLRQGEQSRVTGILRTSLHPMPKSARTNAELAQMQNQPPCAIAKMIRNDTMTLVTGCCETACCRQANFFWLNPLHSSHFTVCRRATWQTAPLLPLFAIQGILQACYETVM